jgi:hydroxysqualene dehydroxylase
VTPNASTPAEATTRPVVAVVGGGLAGMTAALDCADAGAAVTLFESRRALGGAAASQRRDGLTLDTGQHVFLRCCTAYRTFLERIGAASLTQLQERLEIDVVAPGHRSARLRRVALPAPLHLAPALARYRPLSRGERLAAARAALAVRGLDPGDPALDARTLGDWLAEHGQSERAVRRLWDLFVLSALNLRAADASLALAATVLRTGLLERADAGDIGLARVPLSELHHRRAAAALAAAGVDVRLGARVAAIAPGARGLRVACPSGHHEADAVVLAVPVERAAGLLPDGALADPGALAGLGSSPIVNVHVIYDRAVTGLAMAAAVDSPVQWVFDRSRASGLREGQYLALSLSDATALIGRSADELRTQFLPALEELFPAACGATVTWFGVTRARHATFRQAPGADRLRPGAATGVSGLYLAGAWTDTGWPATMEGAVRSGHAAARLALADLAQAGPHEALAQTTTGGASR